MVEAFSPQVSTPKPIENLLNEGYELVRPRFIRGKYIKLKGRRKPKGELYSILLIFKNKKEKKWRSIALLYRKDGTFIGAYYLIKGDQGKRGGFNVINLDKPVKGIESKYAEKIRRTCVGWATHTKRWEEKVYDISFLATYSPEELEKVYKEWINVPWDKKIYSEASEKFLSKYLDFIKLIDSVYGKRIREMYSGNPRAMENYEALVNLAKLKDVEGFKEYLLKKENRKRVSPLTQDIVRKILNRKDELIFYLDPLLAVPYISSGGPLRLEILGRNITLTIGNRSFKINIPSKIEKREEERKEVPEKEKLKKSLDKLTDKVTFKIGEKPVTFTYVREGAKYYSVLSINEDLLPIYIDKKNGSIFLPINGEVFKYENGKWEKVTPQPPLEELEEKGELKKKYVIIFEDYKKLEQFKESLKNIATDFVSENEKISEDIHKSISTIKTKEEPKERVRAAVMAASEALLKFSQTYYERSRKITEKPPTYEEFKNSIKSIMRKSTKNERLYLAFTSENVLYILFKYCKGEIEEEKAKNEITDIVMSKIWHENMKEEEISNIINSLQEFTVNIHMETQNLVLEERKEFILRIYHEENTPTFEELPGFPPSDEELVVMAAILEPTIKDGYKLLLKDEKEFWKAVLKNKGTILRGAVMDFYNKTKKEVRERLKETYTKASEEELENLARVSSALITLSYANSVNFSIPKLTEPSESIPQAYLKIFPSSKSPGSLPTTFSMIKVSEKGIFQKYHVPEVIEIGKARLTKEDLGKRIYDIGNEAGNPKWMLLGMKVELGVPLTKEEVEEVTNLLIKEGFDKEKVEIWKNNIFKESPRFVLNPSETIALGALKKIHTEERLAFNVERAKELGGGETKGTFKAERPKEVGVAETAGVEKESYATYVPAKNVEKVKEEVKKVVDTSQKVKTLEKLAKENTPLRAVWETVTEAMVLAILYPEATHLAFETINKALEII